jgi:hypothetical protein
MTLSATRCTFCVFVTVPGGRRSRKQTSLGSPTAGRREPIRTVLISAHLCTSRASRGESSGLHANAGGGCKSAFIHRERRERYRGLIHAAPARVAIARRTAGKHERDTPHAIRWPTAESLLRRSQLILRGLPRNDGSRRTSDVQSIWTCSGDSAIPLTLTSTPPPAPVFRYIVEPPGTFTPGPSIRISPCSEKGDPKRENWST